LPVTNIANNQIRVFPDIALKSAGIMQFSDAPTYLGNIHEQNTDIGTDSQTFYIGENGPKLKNNSGVLEIVTNDATDYADLVVNNLTVKGSSTVINSEVINIADNIIVLNSNFSGDLPIDDAGIEIERGTQNNAVLLWDETYDLWKAGIAGTEKTIVRENNTVTLTGDVSGTSFFTAEGNISISVSVSDNSHLHSIENVTGLLDTLDNIKMSDLADANLTDAQEGDIIVRTSDVWLNKSLSEAGIAVANHNHDTIYLAINGTAVNADKLDNYDSTYFTTALNINYDNSITHLTASTVQTAIDEIASRGQVMFRTFELDDAGNLMPRLDASSDDFFEVDLNGNLMPAAYETTSLEFTDTGDIMPATII